jgi:Reverse transcriptase (RNA-dependent DNA polymerase)
LILTAFFTEEEVKQAVFHIQGDKAPGPDGLHVLFYQHFWNIIKDDLLNLFEAFHYASLDISKLNRGMVHLIPKKGDALTIKDYRPISLLNCSYKIITRVLTTRLEGVLGRLIQPTQTAFLKERFIMDGVVTAQEILYYSHMNNDIRVLIKLDFEKAFDRLNWDYLLETFSHKNFPTQWIQWIRNILHGGRVCINLNGHLIVYFECTRGVRQGGSLSPLLFILIAEGLGKIL